MTVKVLYVDDDSGLQITAKQILEVVGPFEVVTCSSVDEALKLLNGQEFDEIISDYQMPLKNGLDFLKEVREQGDNTPFILFTGKGREEVAVKALNLGANYYISKVGKPETVFGELVHVLLELAKNKRAEKRLLLSETRFRELFDNMRSGVAVYTVEDDGNFFVFSDFNKAAEKIEGVKKADLIGKDVLEVFPGAKDGFLDVFRRVWKTGKPEYSNSVYSESGKPESIRNSYTYKLPSGEIVSIYNDVTDEKKIEQQLLRNYEMLDTVTRHINADLTIISKDYEVLYANKVITGTYGDVLGKKCYSVLNNQKSVCANCGVKEIFETCKDQVIHYQTVRQPDGTVKHLEITATAIRNEIGEIVSATEIAIDLTESKLIDKKLSEEISLKNVLLDNIPGAALILRKNTREIVASNKLAKEFGAFPGKTCYQTCAKRGDPCAFCRAPEVWETDDVKTLEVKYRGRWYRGIWAPYNDELYVHYFFDITQMKENEFKLKDNLTVLKNLLNTSQFGIGHYDLKGTITLLNPKACEYMQGSLDDFVGKNAKDVFGQKMGHIILDRIKEITESGTIQKFEDNIKLPSGEKWFSSVYKPIINFQNQIIGCQIISIDITEQKNAEQKIADSESMFRSLFMNMQEGVAIHELTYDIVGNPSNYIILDVNKRFEEIVSIKREDAVGKTATVLYAANEPPFFEIYAKVAETGEPERFESHFAPMGKDFKISVFSIKKGSFVTVFEDVTERKKNEKEIRYLARFPDENPDPVLRVTKAGVIIYANHAVQKHCWATIKDGEQFLPQELQEAVFRCLELNSPEEIEVVCDDQVFSFSITPFSDKGYCNIYGRNITERRVAEEKVQDALAELAKRQMMIEGLLTSSRAVLEHRKFKDAASIIFNESKELIEATAGYVALLSDDGLENEVVFLSSGDLNCTVDPTLPMPIRGLRELVYKTGKPVYENSFGGSEFEGFLPKGHVKLENVLFGPMILDEEPVGLIGLANKPGGFTEQDAQIIVAFGKIAVIALRNSKILEELESGKNRATRMNEKLNVVGRLSRHDARNKLSVVANNLYLAKRTLAKDTPALKNLENAEKAISQISNIFDFAHLYEQLGIEEMSQIDVGSCVNEAAISLDLGEIALVNSCDGLSVFADSLLTQVFYNLMHNSLTHGKKVTQVKVYFEESKDHLNLLYEDDGIGIPEQEKELIFNEGYGKGTGYGLYLIRKMCEVYNWTIKETGIPDKGAKFVIDIPTENENKLNHGLE
ncbi:MAG: PAS domain-containing protein [Candidatus Bathyarchaeota archaeon]|nr:MAG: PAS domain-containing protein [Candidatus Bathyarchaeota archaeon]